MLEYAAAPNSNEEISTWYSRVKNINIINKRNRFWWNKKQIVLRNLLVNHVADNHAGHFKQESLRYT